jgi:hypothetical protein
VSGFFGMATGMHVLITGLADDPGGGLRVYVGARYDGHYVICDDLGDIARIRSAWGSTASHVTMPKPPDEALHCDNPAHDHAGEPTQDDGSRGAIPADRPDPLTRREP